MYNQKNKTITIKNPNCVMAAWLGPDIVGHKHIASLTVFPP